MVLEMFEKEKIKVNYFLSDELSCWYQDCRKKKVSEDMPCNAREFLKMIAAGIKAQLLFLHTKMFLLIHFGISGYGNANHVWQDFYLVLFWTYFYFSIFQIAYKLFHCLLSTGCAQKMHHSGARSWGSLLCIFFICSMFAAPGEPSAFRPITLELEMQMEI